MVNVLDYLSQRAASLNATPLTGMPRGLPQPLTEGGPGYTANRNNAPIYSASGLSHIADTPYSQTGGIMSPFLRPQAYAPANEGSMDPLLGMSIKAGHQGGIARGALAFLGNGFNPWTQEAATDTNGPKANPAQAAQIDSLFRLADQLGIDTSKYSRDPGTIGIRGERSSDMNAMALYDRVNELTRDYVSVGGLANGWAGGGAGNVANTIYKEVGGKLLPVTRPQFHQATHNNSFIGRDSLTGMAMMLPIFGGWAGLLGTAGQGTVSAGAGLGLTSSLPAGVVNAGVNTLLAGRVNPMSALSLLGGSSPYQSPMSSFQSEIGASGLGRTNFGRGLGWARLLGALASRVA